MGGSRHVSLFWAARRESARGAARRPAPRRNGPGRGAGARRPAPGAARGGLGPGARPGAGRVLNNRAAGPRAVRVRPGVAAGAQEAGAGRDATQQARAAGQPPAGRRRKGRRSKEPNPIPAPARSAARDSPRPAFLKGGRAPAARGPRDECAALAAGGARLARARALRPKSGWAWQRPYCPPPGAASRCEGPGARGRAASSV